jgi:hypothetical protein
MTVWNTCEAILDLAFNGHHRLVILEKLMACYLGTGYELGAGCSAVLFPLLFCSDNVNYVLPYQAKLFYHPS